MRQAAVLPGELCFSSSMDVVAFLSARRGKPTVREAALQDPLVGGHLSHLTRRRLVSVTGFASRKQRPNPERQAEERRRRKKGRDPWPHPRPLISWRSEGPDQSAAVPLTALPDSG